MYRYPLSLKLETDAILAQACDSSAGLRKFFLSGGPAMDGDLNDLEGLFQEEADVAALSALWSFLEPADRLAVLAVSWYLSTGFHRLLILLAVRGHFP